MPKFLKPVKIDFSLEAVKYTLFTATVACAAAAITVSNTDGKTPADGSATNENAQAQVAAPCPPAKAASKPLTEIYKAPRALKN